MLTLIIIIIFAPVALFFIDAKYKMFLWQGWWPVSDEEHEEEVGPTTAAEKHRFDVSRKLAMQSVVSYAEGMLPHRLFSVMPFNYRISLNRRPSWELYLNILWNL